MFIRELAIDLGSSAVRIAVRGRGVLLEEAALAAQDRKSGDIPAVGAEAEALLASSTGRFTARHPVQNGVIADPAAAGRMLRGMLRRVMGRSPVRPDVLLCLPGFATPVEERAAVDALTGAGVRRVRTMETVRAAALGAGLEPARPVGSMVVDLGHSSCHAAVFAMDCVQEQQCRRFGAAAWDLALQRHMRREYGMLLGSRMAESIRQSAGAGHPLRIPGRELQTGRSMEAELSPEELRQAWTPAALELREIVEQTLELAPPVLLGDLRSEGIRLTGGGSLIPGLAEALSASLGLPVRTVEDPLHAVIRGATAGLGQKEKPSPIRAETQTAAF
ncbi:MAG: rod shape-determining protein [Ruminococcaceae bacterium]|nr:rod shape-determining protein [Oscillospiraceae bacterium]